MITLTSLFEKRLIGGGVTSTKDDWFDIGSLGPDNCSPITSGYQLWIGYGIFIAEDKALTFEIRGNLTTKSAGTVADTLLLGFAAPSLGESSDIDFTYNNNILTLIPSNIASTGVEKIWLRVRSGSAVAGTFSYMIHYTIN